MRGPTRILLVALLLLAAAGARAQTGPMQKVQAVLEEVARGLSFVGKNLDQYIGPGWRWNDEKKPPHEVTREFSDRYPVGPNPLVAISNEFGTIRVNTWDDRVIQVNAEIRVGAETAAIANEVADAVRVGVTPNEELVEVKTLLPDTREDMGLVNITIDYLITVPESASIIADNFFGDTYISGVDGLVAVESQYGAIELDRIGGAAKVRAHGEFPLRATGLAAGGVFQLNGTQAVFAGISGELQVGNFRGTVHLSKPAGDAFIDITNDSGPITVDLGPDSSPDLSATVLYGNIESNLALSRSTQASKTVARLPSPESGQHIVLNASFADIYIEQQEAEGKPSVERTGRDKLFTDVVLRAESAPEGASIVVNAVAGDLRVEPYAGPEVRVTATRVVWVPSASKAPLALEALALEVQRSAEQLSFSTLATRDMKTLECSAYRIDLLVECPPGFPLSVRAERGLTIVKGIDAPVTVLQTEGEVRAEAGAGPHQITNQNGSITVTGCLGPVEVSARYGDILLSRVAGDLKVENLQGRTLIEAAGAGVTVRNTGGDIRILALDGVSGAYDAAVTNGDLSILLPPEPDVVLSAFVQGGVVRSSMLLDGTIHGDLHEFRGRLQEGKYPVRLEAQGGDVTID